MSAPYALSPHDLSTLLAMRGQRLLRDLDRQRAQLRAAGRPGPCVPVRPTPAGVGSVIAEQAARAKAMEGRWARD
jgi:hypothetical protein